MIYIKFYLAMVTNFTKDYPGFRVNFQYGELSYVLLCFSLSGPG